MSRRVLGLVLSGALAITPAAISRPESGGGESPNLTPVIGDIRIWPPGTGPGGTTALGFATIVKNVGAVALDLVGVLSGVDPSGNGTATALQCVNWVAPACTRREAVGELAWHPTHAHFHFQDFALYELRRLDAAQQPDMTPAGLIVQGQKTSFCLQDSERAEPGESLGNPAYSLCMLGVQGISAGWADTYQSYLAGQSLVIDGVPDGDYAIVVTVDPSGRFTQTRTDDDGAFAVVTLAGGRVACADPALCHVPAAT